MAITQTKMCFLESQEEHQMGIHTLLECFPSHFSQFIPGKGGHDNNQQALASGKMIKMFINTDLSR